MKTTHAPVGYSMILSIFMLGSLAYSQQAPQQSVNAVEKRLRHTPPPIPLVRPQIITKHDNDLDGDCIEDELLTKLKTKKTKRAAAKDAKEAAEATKALGEKVMIELIFREQITQKQIDDFEGLGGEITHVYKSVSYGWNGFVPLEKIELLPNVLGATLVNLSEAKPVQLFLERATRTSRVRPIWGDGFAGSTSGFDGDPSITIGVIDSGIDGNHADLSGRQEFWQDYTSSASATPTDPNQHGTHVTGIALGTGASRGSGSGILQLSQKGKFGPLNGVNSYIASAFSLAPNQTNLTITASWVGGGNAEIGLYSRNKGDINASWAPPQAIGLSFSIVGSSPATLNINGFTASVSQEYTLYVKRNSTSMTNYAISCAATNQPQSTDGFNLLRGIAPECRWAGARALDSNGSGFNSHIGAAIDGLVSERINHNIRVINMSLGSINLDSSLRIKVNNAVANGIVVVVAAGNSGSSNGTIGDPGRAALAITVAASNDENRLTDYTSIGDTLAPDGTEDYKPDIMAPGGSQFFRGVMSTDSGTADSNDSSIGDFAANDYTNDIGTSMAAPVVAGSAALIVDALNQQNGFVWNTANSNHPLFVKMLLCATASESNQNREDNDLSKSPSLQRSNNGPTNGAVTYPVGKDPHEGYGIMNPDAAIQAIRLQHTIGTTQTGTLGATGATDNTTAQRVWARGVSLIASQTFRAELSVPTSADYDLYLYSATPSATGKPEILASSTTAGDLAEAFTYASPGTVPAFAPGSDSINAYLVVKKISGSGTFSLSTVGPRILLSTTVGQIQQNNSVDFSNSPSLVVGGSKTITFTIANGGYATLNSLAITKDGLNTSDFVVTGPTLTQLATGASTTFTVKFAPKANGYRTAQLHIASNDLGKNPFDFTVYGSANGPLLQVNGNGQFINSDSNPTLSNFTDFGIVALNNESLTRTFTVTNSGSVGLTVTSIVESPASTEFSNSAFSTTAIAPGASRNLSVTFDPTFVGVHSHTLNITANYVEPTVFKLRMQGTCSNPNILVSGNGNVIPDGTIVASTALHTDFGMAALTNEQIARTYTIQNNGQANLIITSITRSGVAAAEFTAGALFSPATGYSAMPATIPTGESRTFTVYFDPAALGVRNATLNINCNDPDTPIYNFAVAGTSSNPEIDIIGKGLSILDGDTTPTSIDGTDFGFGYSGGNPETRSYTVHNSGTASLILTGITMTGLQSSAFSASPQPTYQVIPVGGTFDFTVTFMPAVTGSNSATLNVLCNDPNEATYNYSIKGTGVLYQGVDPQFTSAFLGTSNYIFSAMPLPDGKILVAGGGAAKLSEYGSLDGAFSGVTTNGTFYNALQQSATAGQPSGAIIFIGAFTTVNGQPRNNIARVNMNGNLDTSYQPNVNGQIVGAALLPDNRLYIAGDFTAVDGVTRKYVARLLPDGALDTSFHFLGGNTGVQSVAVLPDGKLMLGGAGLDSSFQVPFVYRSGYCRLNSDGSYDSSFPLLNLPNTNGMVRCVASDPDGRTIIGGAFTNAGGFLLNRMTRLDSAGVVDWQYNPNVTGTNAIVMTISQQVNGWNIIAGEFTSVTGSSCKHVAQLSPGLPCGLIGLNNLNPTGTPGSITCVSNRADGRILIAGSFTAVGGVAKTNLAQIWQASSPESLTISQDRLTLTWARNWTGPEAQYVTFELWDQSTSTWIMLDFGSRVLPLGTWQLTLASPLPSTGRICARARTIGGMNCGSSALVEEVLDY
ncbi:MAG: choice-of-anchor D domain-containing protein [Verrucomicrobiaceae bacterium]|nr:choice-of-anchor D domain-containing protein [Verrucomicrobiaceae bacterium]